MNVAVLVDIIKETKANWRFIFEDPLVDQINMIPGMLVQLCCKPGQDDSVVRNYSVASWQDGTPRFELIVTNLVGGKMSDYLFKEAKIGDEFVYRGPMGVFTLPDDLTERDIYFVSTGSGISPFRSMINDIYINKRPFKNIKLFFGTRTEADIVYRDELELIDQNLPGFEYIPTLSQEKVSGIAEGYVHNHYLKLIDSLDEKPLVYYCGWDRMIRDGRMYLAERGFEMTRDIRVEIFG
jgi:CDP-4-dehydro-6-deoxyglucose reductase